MSIPLENRIGQKFHRLTVIGIHSKGRTSENGKQIQARLLVRCDCGVVKDVAVSNITSGNTRGCGCHTLRPIKKHGMSKDPLYKLWTTVRARAIDPTSKDYGNYGGRGIGMEPEWADDFQSFQAWISENLGAKPSKAHSLDRINNDLGYLKGNLRWATSQEQQNNRRSNKLIAYQGVTSTMKEQCLRLGLNYSTVKMRLGSMGWTVEQALGIPTDGSRRRKISVQPNSVHEGV